jgi:hypothetical protein
VALVHHRAVVEQRLRDATAELLDGGIEDAPHHRQHLALLVGQGQ